MKRVCLVALILLLVFTSTGCKSVATQVSMQMVSTSLAATMTTRPKTGGGSAQTPFAPGPATGSSTEVPFPTWLPTVAATPEPSTTAPSLQGADAEIVQPLAQGWQRYEVPQEGFAISMPPEWARLEPVPKVLSEFVAILNEQVDQFGLLFSAEKAQQLVTEGVKLHGSDVSRQGVPPGPPGMLYVSKVDFGLPMVADLFLEANIAKLEAVDDPDKPVSVQRVQLANHEALELRWRLIVPGLHDDTIIRDIIQYIVLDEGAIYVVSLYSPPETADYYRPTLEAIGKSFELLE